MENNIYIGWVLDIDSEDNNDFDLSGATFTTKIETDKFEDWDNLSEENKQALIDQAVAEDFNNRVGYIQTGVIE